MNVAARVVVRVVATVIVSGVFVPTKLGVERASDELIEDELVLRRDKVSDKKRIIQGDGLMAPGSCKEKVRRRRERGLTSDSPVQYTRAKDAT